MSAQPTERPAGASPKAPDWGVSYGIADLWSEVLPGLWVGGTGDEDTTAYSQPYFERRNGDRQPSDRDVEVTTDSFEAVVTMYAWARPVGWGVQELRYGIMDSPSSSSFDLDSLKDTVVWAHKKWSKGDRVLVRCQAGLNRSSLVAALVLVREGIEPRDAIRAIREGRSHRCLFNEAFEAFVLAADAAYWRA